jgi:nitrogen regulatory protein A
MDSFDIPFDSELERLRAATGSDLAAYAAPADSELRWRWVRAAGASGVRLPRLAVQPGRGIVGAVLRTGRPIVLDRHKHAAQLRKDDAQLLLAERLSTVAAAPVLRSGSATGVLLLGSRTGKDYDSAAVQLLTAAAARLEAVQTPQS